MDITVHNVAQTRPVGPGTAVNDRTVRRVFPLMMCQLMTERGEDTACGPRDGITDRTLRRDRRFINEQLVTERREDTAPGPLAAVNDTPRRRVLTVDHS